MKDEKSGKPIRQCDENPYSHISEAFNLYSFYYLIGAPNLNKRLKYEESFSVTGIEPR